MNAALVKATRQRNDRKRYRAAGVVMEEVKKGDPFTGRWGSAPKQDP